MTKLQRIITVEIEVIDDIDEFEMSKEETTDGLKRFLLDRTDATHVNVVRVQDFIHEDDRDE